MKSLHNSVLCLECKKRSFKNNSCLSTHINRIHKINCEQYVLKHKYNNVRPVCGCGCGQETTFRKGGIFDFAVFRQGHKTQEQRANIFKKMQQTNLKRYGAKNYFSSERLLGKTRLGFKEILERCNRKGYDVCFSEEEYREARQYHVFYCRKHRIQFSSSMFMVSTKQDRQCPMCKQSKGHSYQEKQILNYVKSIFDGEIIANAKNVLPNRQELDIFIPSKNIAIEYDGLYWHSEIYRDKNYHLSKFRECEEKNIQLIQIYEDEWRDKQETWKSILNLRLERLNKFKKIKTGTTKLDEAPKIEEMKCFLNQNHLRGYEKAMKNFVLRDKSGEILFCLAVGESEKKKLEIIRVCSKNWYLIDNGFTKLLKYVKLWAKKQGFSSIFTYVDCRYHFGELYKNSGLENVGHTGFGYCYTDFSNRFKTKKQSATYKLYNCGNYIWSVNLRNV